MRNTSGSRRLRFSRHIPGFRRVRVACVVMASAVTLSLVGNGVGVAAAAVTGMTPGGQDGQYSAAVTSQIIPKPSKLRALSGESYTITAGTGIFARSAGAAPIASYIAGLLRPATGFSLPVSTRDQGS